MGRNHMKVAFVQICSTDFNLSVPPTSKATNVMKVQPIINALLAEKYHCDKYLLVMSFPKYTFCVLIKGGIENKYIKMKSKIIIIIGKINNDFDKST